MKERINRHMRRIKVTLWSVALLVGGATLLPLTGYVYVDLVSAQAADTDPSNPRANYWRSVREGNAGYVASRGPYTTNVLIQNGGQNWRQIRNGPIATYAPWVLATVVGLIILFHIFCGRVRVESELSGRTVARWSSGERLLHWYTAVLFIILAITGLSLLFGRAVLIPVLGPAGFAAWANLAIAAHNYLGPFFVVGILLEILVWFRFNLPNKHDLEWIKKGGGLLRKGQHPPSGRMNAGEKLWFWIIATVGVAVCVTGLILDFPNYEQTRETMQIASVIHTITALLWAAIAIGHIWIGTLGTEGSLQGMTTGRVSSEWAQQHHNLWYEEVKHTEEMDTGAGEPSRAADQPG